MDMLSTATAINKNVERDIQEFNTYWGSYENIVECCLRQQPTGAASCRGNLHGCRRLTRKSVNSPFFPLIAASCMPHRSGSAKGRGNPAFPGRNNIFDWLSSRSSE